MGSATASSSDPTGTNPMPNHAGIFGAIESAGHPVAGEPIPPAEGVLCPPIIVRISSLWSVVRKRRWFCEIRFLFSPSALLFRRPPLLSSHFSPRCSVLLPAVGYPF
jgi:hypothetical protein